MGNAGYEIGSARENRTEAGHFKLDTVERAPTPVIRRHGSRLYKISWIGLPCPSSGGVGATSTKNSAGRTPMPVIRRHGSRFYKISWDGLPCPSLGGVGAASTKYRGTGSHARHSAAWEPLLQNIVGRAPMPVTRRRGSRFYKISWDGLPCPSSGGVGAASTKNSAGRAPTPVARQRSCLYIKKSSSPPYRTASRAPRPSRTSCAAGRHPG